MLSLWLYKGRIIFHKIATEQGQTAISRRQSPIMRINRPRDSAGTYIIYKIFCVYLRAKLKILYI